MHRLERDAEQVGSLYTVSIATFQPVPDDFDVALAEFEVVTARLREELEHRQAFRIASPLAEAATDIVAFSGILREVHIVARDAIDKETGAISGAIGRIGDPPDLLEQLGRAMSERPTEISPTPHTRRLLAGYKAWSYFMRIYQDWLYGALMGILTGNYPERPLMKKALAEPKRKRDRNPVRAYLDLEAPDYIDWFRDFAELRSTLKNSVPAHTRGSEALGQPIDYGLGLTDEKGDLRIIRLRHLTTALRRSVEAVDAATRAA